jgi:hypothetical protein
MSSSSCGPAHQEPTSPTPTTHPPDPPTAAVTSQDRVIVPAALRDTVNTMPSFAVTLIW